MFKVGGLIPEFSAVYILSDALKIREREWFLHNYQRGTKRQGRREGGDGMSKLKKLELFTTNKLKS